MDCGEGREKRPQLKMKAIWVGPTKSLAAAAGIFIPGLSLQYCGPGLQTYLNAQK